MTTYLGNAFSLNMLDVSPEGIYVEIRPIDSVEIPSDAESIIGHVDMAAIVSGILNRSVAVNRETVTLVSGDILFVAQYRGERLPAGATILPTDARLEFYRITIHSK